MLEATGVYRWSKHAWLQCAGVEKIKCAKL